jgi:hypothetical protein
MNKVVSGWLQAAAFFSFDPQTSDITQHYEHNPYQADSLADAKLIELYCDQAGVLWVGTDCSGLWQVLETAILYIKLGNLRPGERQTVVTQMMGKFQTKGFVGFD